MTTTTAQARPARRARRLLIKTGVVGAAAAALLTATAAEASASTYPSKIGNTAPTQRDCYHDPDGTYHKQPYPSQNCSPIQVIPAGTAVTLVCQYQGQSIYGDPWWDYVRTPAGYYGYVSDYYVNTGQSQYRVPGVDLCNY